MPQSLVLSPRGVRDPRGVGNAGWVWLWRRDARLTGNRGWVAGDPSRALSGRQDAAHGEVEAADRGRRQRPALVGLALQHDAAGLGAAVRRVAGCRGPTRRATMFHDAALMVALDAVLDPRATVTADSAAAQLGVERIQNVGRDAADRLVTERRVEVHPRVVLVALARRLLDVEHPQPRVHRNAEAGFGLRRPLVVNLGTEPAQDLLDLGLGLGRAGEPDLLAGDGVQTGVDQHSEGTSTLADVSARATLVDLPGHARDATR